MKDRGQKVIFEMLTRLAEIGYQSKVLEDENEIIIFHHYGSNDVLDLSNPHSVIESLTAMLNGHSAAKHCLIKREVNESVRTVKSIIRHHPSLEKSKYYQVDLLLKELEQHLIEAKKIIDDIDKNREACDRGFKARLDLPF